MWKTYLIEQIRTALTLFRILAIKSSSKLRLSWFKWIWKDKRELYNFHDLNFQIFGLNLGRNWSRSWCTCAGDVFGSRNLIHGHDVAYLGIPTHEARNYAAKNTLIQVILRFYFVFFKYFWLQLQLGRFFIRFRILLGFC